MKDKTLIQFGKHIRNLREAHGFSQEGFAAKAGLTRTYYGCIERGEKNISLRYLYKLAKALNVPIQELFPH